MIPRLITTSLLALLAIAPLSAGSSSSSPDEAAETRREMNVELRFREIECRATTEWGHDEVFVLLTLFRPDKSPVTIPFPNSSFAGDADDGASLDFSKSGGLARRYFGSRPVTSEPLERHGEKIVAVFTFWESDHDWGGWFIANLDKITMAVTVAVDPAALPEASSIAKRVQAAIKSLNVDTNPHDYIGSYGIELKWNGGAETVNALSMGPHTVKVGPGMRDPQGLPGYLGPDWEYFRVRMTGSGSEYYVETYVRTQLRG